MDTWQYEYDSHWESKAAYIPSIRPTYDRSDWFNKITIDKITIDSSLLVDKKQELEFGDIEMERK